MDTTHVVRDDWPCVLAMLPPDIEQSAAAMGALVRRRQIKSASDLLRLALCYGLCDFSLVQTAAWAALAGVGELCGVAVFKRLCKAEQWLGHILVQCLQMRGMTTNVPPARVLVLDATVICGPRSKGTDWRVHLGLDLDRQQISTLELTGPREGETLLRHEIAAGQIVLADRGYGHREGVANVLKGGGHVVVRIASGNFPLESPEGAPIAIPDLFEGLRVTQVGDWPVQFKSRDGVWPMRLVAVRKARPSAIKEQARLGHEAKRKGRQPDDRSLRAAHFIILLTDLPAADVSAAQVAELYRLRWQVELYFKRLKSILQLDHLRSQKPALSRAYLCAKLIGALMIDQLWGEADTFSPWGYALAGSRYQPMASDGPAV